MSAMRAWSDQTPDEDGVYRIRHRRRRTEYVAYLRVHHQVVAMDTVFYEGPYCLVLPPPGHPRLPLMLRGGQIPADLTRRGYLWSGPLGPIPTPPD